MNKCYSVTGRICRFVLLYRFISSETKASFEQKTLSWHDDREDALIVSFLRICWFCLYLCRRNALCRWNGLMRMWRHYELVESGHSRRMVGYWSNLPLASKLNQYAFFLRDKLVEASENIYLRVSISSHFFRVFGVHRCWLIYYKTLSCKVRFVSFESFHFLA